MQGGKKKNLSGTTEELPLDHKEYNPYHRGLPASLVYSLAAQLVYFLEQMTPNIATQDSKRGLAYTSLSQKSNTGLMVLKPRCPEGYMHTMEY